MVVFGIVLRRNDIVETQYVLFEFLTPRKTQSLFCKEKESMDQGTTRSNYIVFLIIIEETVNATEGHGYFPRKAKPATPAQTYDTK